MVESITSRLGLPRWTEGTDSPSRAEFDGAMASLETNAAMFGQGTRAARPAAGKAGRLWRVVSDAVNAGMTFYDDGSAWSALGQVVEDAVSRSSAATTIAQVIQGAANQSVRLTEWRNSGGSVLAFVDNLGKATFATLTSTGTLVVSGITTLAGALNANGGVSTTTLQTSGVATINSLQSSAKRADGAPATQLDVGGGARLDGLIPPGSMVLYAGTGTPAGWLRCDGSAVSRTTYADLYAVIGTTYGAGNGSSTFNLPDLRDRYVVGAGQSKAAGDSDGLASASRAARLAHTVTVSGSVSSVGDHTHTIPGQPFGGQMRSAGSGAYSAPSQQEYEGHAHGGKVGADGGHSHTWSGGGSAPEHPSLAVLMLIRT